MPESAAQTHRDTVRAGTVSCTRRLQFCSGHRVMGHENKCAHLHGHNYVVEITAEPSGGRGLDGIGRVIDFSVLKEKVGGWIEDNWDHGMVLHVEDPWYEVMAKAEPTQKLRVMPYNPTAENMAKFLLEQICPQVLADTGILVTRVVVHETENCWAEANIRP